MVKGKATCWCFAMPRILPVSATEHGGRCYCRECLTRVIEEREASAGVGSRLKWSE
jgi:hypothetical protein